MTILMPTSDAPSVTIETDAPVLTIDRTSRLHRLNLSAGLAELFRINKEVDDAIAAQDAEVSLRTAIVSDAAVFGGPLAPAVVDDSPAALIARLTAGDRQ